MWNERYNRPEYVYGKEPNLFLAEASRYLQNPARILSLGEGEGRNAVYLAGLGHSVTAVDSSSVGLKKAAALAKEKGITLHFIERDITRLKMRKNEWDAIISIFFHLPSVERKQLHKKCIKAIKPGGYFIMEAYSRDQLKYQTGGPKIEDMLLELNELKNEFEDMVLLKAEEKVRNLAEGDFHNGDSSVIQLIARKPL